MGLLETSVERSEAWALATGQPRCKPHCSLSQRCGRGQVADDFNLAHPYR